jgi:hypothetical protein
VSAIGEVWERLDGSAELPRRIEITGELTTSSGARLWRWRALQGGCPMRDSGVIAPADLALAWRRLDRRALDAPTAG